MERVPIESRRRVLAGLQVRCHAVDQLALVRFGQRVEHGDLGANGGQGLFPRRVAGDRDQLVHGERERDAIAELAAVEHAGPIQHQTRLANHLTGLREPLQVVEGVLVPILEGGGDAENRDRLAGEAVVDLDRFGDGAEEAAGAVDLEDLDQDHVAALLIQVRGGALHPGGNAEVGGGLAGGNGHGGVEGVKGITRGRHSLRPDLSLAARQGQPGFHVRATASHRADVPALFSLRGSSIPARSAPGALRTCACSGASRSAAPEARGRPAESRAGTTTSPA